MGEPIFSQFLREIFNVGNNSTHIHLWQSNYIQSGLLYICLSVIFCWNLFIPNYFPIKLSFTCDFPDEAVPCENAQDFFYLNDRLGDPKAFFHDQNDIERAAPLIASRRGVSYQARAVAPQPRPAPKIQPLVPPPAPPPSPAAGRRPFARKPSKRQPVRKY